LKNRVLRKIAGYEMKEVTGALENGVVTSFIICMLSLILKKMIKLRRIRGTGHVGER
jgi:hypothetical protein